MCLRLFDHLVLPPIFKMFLTGSDGSKLYKTNVLTIMYIAQALQCQP